MYVSSMILVIASSVFYHVFQHAIPKDLNPLLSMAITYAVALAVTLALLFAFPSEKNGSWFQLTSIPWPTCLLGVSIVGLELGFLLAYRAGWNISVAALLATATVTLILVPAGIYIYKESFDVVKAIGVALSMLGIFLINR